MVAWWYVEAEDFSEQRVSGVYVLRHDGITQKIVLRPNHTFDQEDAANGAIRHGSGTWRVFSSTGHVAFSSSFIDARPSWRGQDEHEVYGVFKNYFGIVSLNFDADQTSITAFKRLFS